MSRKNTYCAILFTPDGQDYVKDFHGCKTKDEVWDKVEDMGSRWIFYPIVFVITEYGAPHERAKVVSASTWVYEDCIGLSIKTIQKILKRMYDNDPNYWNY